MIHWLARQLSESLRRRLSEPKLKKAFAVLPDRPAKPDVRPFQPRSAGDQSPVRVCAVQAEVKLYSSLEKMAADIDRFFSDAQDHQTELICFPEFFGMLPLGLLPGVRFGLRMLNKFKKRTPESSQEAKAKSVRKNKEKTGPRQIPPLPELLQPFDFLQNRYTELMARFAKRYGMYVSCGTLLAPENGKVYNRHIFLGPDGSVLGIQDKLHLTETERELGISTGDALSVVPTPIGNIALMVCMDASYFETFRIAKHLGAHYAIVPIGDMAEFQPWLALRGTQTRVSETGLAAIKSALVSKPSFPMVFTGRAGIWFPLSSGKKSIEAPQHNSSTAVYGEIDLVPQHKNDLPGCRTNPAFDRRYAEELIKKSKDFTKQ
ncbi:MAG TPA: nitrilase-related carbon-nitrogen hydrolase [Oscillospiraceae bacterium]|nr:nitrilase-related carbon-nitrogen hydrolase [Oscillospiraceae bacterium]HPS34307.1 nitrilase-related carbon-nitrogen hydrolase [Oscillospiraceae bacterium]